MNSANKKNILITGATDGIGLETARKLHKLGHNVIVHGRSLEKLKKVEEELGCQVFRADLSTMEEVEKLANDILSKLSNIDVLINNAGVYKIPNPITEEGQDLRFIVNTIAPYLLTKKLLPLMNTNGRVINLSSAAQSSVEFDALLGKKQVSDFEAYAQSKLAITMWSRFMANELKGSGPIVIAVNPGSLLATKMVKEGFNTSGNDINIGVNILCELSLDEKHSESSGKYFDNDSGEFSSPLADGLDDNKTKELVAILEEMIK
jgi:NAD(P)-dependent dehydrogenase (short-subunit alcohol dehydrogenase family)